MKRDVFQAIADPTRRAILLLIATQAMTPNALADHFASSRQAVSKHIHVLLESELLRQQQQGREIYYYLNPDRIHQVDEWLQHFKALAEQRFAQLDDVLATLKTKQN